MGRQDLVSQPDTAIAVPDIAAPESAAPEIAEPVGEPAAGHPVDDLLPLGRMSAGALQHVASM